LQEEIAKALSTVKVMLYGSVERPVDEEAAQKLCDEFIAQDLVPLLLTNLSSYQFEVRLSAWKQPTCPLRAHAPMQSKKDVAAIFNNLLRKKPTDADNQEKYPFCDYVAARPAIIDLLVCGYVTAFRRSL
jgi:hypothetical protein